MAKTKELSVDLKQQIVDACNLEMNLGAEAKFIVQYGKINTR